MCAGRTRRFVASVHFMLWQTRRTCSRPQARACWTQRADSALFPRVSSSFSSFSFSPTAKSSPQLPSGCTLCPPSASNKQTAGDSLQISPLRSANFLGATPTDGWAKDNGPSLYRTAGLKGKSCRKKLDPVRFNPTGRGLFKSALQYLSLGRTSVSILWESH